MTSLVSCQSSHDCDCKQYSPEFVEGPLRPYFPALVRSSRFVELRPRALGSLWRYLPTRKGRGPGLPLVASTALAVCHTRRLSRHRVCAG